MRTALFIAFALALGFGLGRLSHRPSRASSPPAALAEKSAPAGIATAAPAPATSPGPAITPVSTGRPENPLHTRIEVVRLLRQSGASFNVPVFRRDVFSPELEKILALTPDEMVRLNAAALEAKRALVSSRLVRASSNLSEDGKLLQVSVPAIDAPASRAVYERLIDALSTTLGPERYEMFNHLTGESFERSFDQFGLNTVSYELTLEPKSSATDAPTRFHYLRRYQDPTGASRGSTGSMTTLAQIEQNDPVLAHFISAHLRNPTGR